MAVMNDEIIEQLTRKPEQSAYLLRSSLKLFIQVFHYYMHRKQFVFKPFHLKIIEKLEKIIQGENEKPNLYIGIAPRYGKSQIVVYFIAFGYALNPYCNFIHTSYGSDLVGRFSGEIKNIVQSDLFGMLFNIHISDTTSAKDLWKIENGGEFRATSLGGVITGFGAGVAESGWGGALMIDDFMKAGDYRSATAKENVVDIYKNTLKSRRNNVNTPIIIIAQRLAKDDLIGWLQENEADDWDFFILPTLNEETGEVIWEEKHSAEVLLKMKQSNPFLFYSQYQQEPIILGGEVIKTDWFRYYPLNVTYKYKKVFITADTAQKVRESNDYSVFGVWGVTTDDRLHLLDLLRGKWESPELKRKAVELWNHWVTYKTPCSCLYVEDKVSGTGLIQELKASCGIPILPLKPDSDKLTRVEAILTYIEAGLVYLPESPSYNFNKDFLAECEAFTRDDSHKHDDIVDVLAYGVKVGISRTEVSILEVL
jgi:predicted phage terminase large subunit-like protein